MLKNKNVTVIETVGTHNGSFHCDDAMAVAVIADLLAMQGDACRVVRSRDPKVLAACSVLVDVGGVYDPITHRYDHHQTGRAGARDNGVLYSSAGLVWKHWGPSYVRATLGEDVPDDLVTAVWARVDERLMQAIDATDNGQELMSGGTANFAGARGVSLSAVIASLNPTWMEDSVHDAAFEGAVAFAGAILKRAIAEAEGHVAARDAVLGALSSQGGDPQVLILNRFVPWQEHLLASGATTLFVVFPDESGTWMCQAVPKEAHSFEKRKPLPAAWAGARDEKFQELAGVEDGVFCHPGLFICGARSRESALRLATRALEA